MTALIQGKEVATRINTTEEYLLMREESRKNEIRTIQREEGEIADYRMELLEDSGTTLTVGLAPNGVGKYIAEQHIDSDNISNVMDSESGETFTQEKDAIYQTSGDKLKILTKELNKAISTREVRKKGEILRNEIREAMEEADKDRYQTDTLVSSKELKDSMSYSISKRTLETGVDKTIGSATGHAESISACNSIIKPQKIYITLISNEKENSESTFERALVQVNARESSRSTQDKKVYLTKLTMKSKLHSLEISRIRIENTRKFEVDWVAERVLPEEMYKTNVFIIVIELDNEKGNDMLLEFINFISRQGCKAIVSICTSDDAEQPKTDLHRAHRFIKDISQLKSDNISVYKSSSKNFVKAFPKLLLKSCQLSVETTNKANDDSKGQEQQQKRGQERGKGQGQGQDHYNENIDIVETPKTASVNISRDRASSTNSNTLIDRVSQGKPKLERNFDEKRKYSQNSVNKKISGDLTDGSKRSSSETDKSSTDTKREVIQGDNGWLGYHLSGLWSDRQSSINIRNSSSAINNNSIISGNDNVGGNGNGNGNNVFQKSQLYFSRSELLKKLIKSTEVDFNQDINYVKLFLLVYPKFMTSEEFFSYLENCFFSNHKLSLLTMPKGKDFYFSNTKDYVNNSSLLELKIYLSNVLLSWVQEYLYDDFLSNKSLLHKVLSFATENSAQPRVKAVLDSIVEKLSVGLPNKFMDSSKSPKFIQFDKLKSLSPTPDNLDSKSPKSRKFTFDFYSKLQKSSTFDLSVPTELLNSNSKLKPNSKSYSNSNSNSNPHSDTHSNPHSNTHSNAHSHFGPDDTLAGDLSATWFTSVSHNILSTNSDKRKSSSLLRKSLSSHVGFVEASLANGNIVVFSATERIVYMHYKLFAKLLSSVEILTFKNISSRDLLNYLWKPSLHKRLILDSTLKVTDDDKISLISVDNSISNSVDLSNDDVEKSSLLPSIDFTNFVSGWVSQSILAMDTPQLRALMMECFVRLASELYSLKNLSTLNAILSGINCAAVSRLWKTREIFSKSKYHDRLLKLEALMSSDRSYSRYRAVEKSLFPNYVPFLPILLGDLIHCDEILKDKSELGDHDKPVLLINWRKYEMMGKLVLRFRQVQNSVTKLKFDTNSINKFLSQKILSADIQYERSLYVEPRAGLNTTIVNSQSLNTV